MKVITAHNDYRGDSKVIGLLRNTDDEVVFINTQIHNALPGSWVYFAHRFTVTNFDVGRSVPMDFGATVYIRNKDKVSV